MIRFLAAAVHLAAANTDLPAVPVALLSAGMGVLATVLSGRIVVPTFSYNRERDRADQADLEVKRLNQAIQDKHVPALESASQAIREATQLLHDLERDRILGRERGDPGNPPRRAR